MKIEGIPLDSVDNELDCDIIISVLKVNSRNYVTVWTNFPWESHALLSFAIG